MTSLTEQISMPLERSKLGRGWVVGKFVSWNVFRLVSRRVTVNVVLKAQLSDAPLNYDAGDHVGIMADNRRELVEPILNRLANKPLTNEQAVQLELLEEKHTPMGSWLTDGHSDKNLQIYLIFVCFQGFRSHGSHMIGSRV